MRLKIVLIILLGLFSFDSYAGNLISFNTEWHFFYENGEKRGKKYNKINISRGNLTLKLKPTSWFQPRMALDAHQDDSGDFKIRLEHLCAKFIVPIENLIITEPGFEVGLVHNPWFDYEENINNYRAEGEMFIERFGILNSADLGFTFVGLIGNKLPSWYRESVSRKYPGTFGSFAFGVYNGGGYHAKENNTNKTFMSRISLRPFGAIFPYLQFSHFFISGKGNTSEGPEWRLNNFMVSFEHKYYVLTGQYVDGHGNQKGNLINMNREAVEYHGGSVFGEVKLSIVNSSIIGRFDKLKQENKNAKNKVIAGYAYHFYKYNFGMLSFNHTSQKGKVADFVIRLTFQVKL